jgi:hypothetical protein
MIKTTAFYLRAMMNIARTPKTYRSDYWQSLRKIRQIQQEPLPWMNYLVIQYLDSQIPRNSKIFEYGSGSSTEYWLNKDCRVTSIEHDRAFYREMEDRLTGRCEYHLVESESAVDARRLSPDCPDSFVSADFKEFNFERYVKSIDTFENETFDMVVVDGRARPSCIKRAIPKIKSQGLLVLDNSDRKYYLIKTGKLLNGWQSRTFRGTVRGLLHLEQTTVFRKP